MFEYFKTRKLNQEYNKIVKQLELSISNEVEYKNKLSPELKYKLINNGYVIQKFIDLKDTNVYIISREVMYNNLTYNNLNTKNSSMNTNNNLKHNFKDSHCLYLDV